MTVFVEVENCTGCPYCTIMKQTDEDHFCLKCYKCNRFIDTVATVEEAVKKEIPDWCPFKTKEEQNEALRQQRIYDSLMGKDKK
jgi:GTP cyclohydrolase FolE2